MGLLKMFCIFEGKKLHVQPSGTKHTIWKSGDFLLGRSLLTSMPKFKSSVCEQHPITTIVLYCG